MPTLTMQQVQDLSRDPSNMVKFQQLLKTEGIDASNDDLSNPYSPRYKATMNSIQILIMKMELIDELTKLNLPTRVNTEVRSKNDSFVPEPEKRAQINEQNGVKSILSSIDSLKIASLLNELENDIAEYFQTQHTINNLNQQLQTAQVALNRIDQQIAVAQQQASHAPAQHMPVQPQQQQNRPVPTVIPIPPQAARKIPQHSVVVKKDGVKSDPGVIGRYIDVPVETLRVQRTQFTVKIIDISGRRDAQDRKSAEIRQRVENNFSEIRKHLHLSASQDRSADKITHNLRNGNYDRMIEFLKGLDSQTQHNLMDIAAAMLNLPAPAMPSR